MTTLNLKQTLLDAFGMERKAQDIYDMVWKELSKEQRANIQKTLIGILFNGEQETFNNINNLYREDKTKIMPIILRDIQCFHRTAMAFSRRQKKEEEQVEQIDEVIALIGAVTNTVSSTEPTTEKKKRDGSTSKRPAKQDNPEHLIQKAISLITRDDVKVLLQQALIQMKLGLTQHANLNQTFITPFAATTAVDDKEVVTTTTSDSDVWW